MVRHAFYLRKGVDRRLERSDAKNILPRLPAPYVAAALNTLPPAETAAEDAMEAIVDDVPGIGNVRVTAKRMKARRSKSDHYFWAAVKAIAT